MTESGEIAPNNPDYSPASSEAGSIQPQMDIMYVESAWAGPIPPPDAVQAYEKMTPGAADRILTITEKQQDHSHRVTEKQQEHEHRMEERVIGIQETVVVSDVKQSFSGLWIGFAIAVLGILSGTALGIFGPAWLGGVVAGVPLTYLVGVFVYGSRSRRDERSRNASDSFPE